MPGLASIVLVREDRVLAIRPEHPLSARGAVGPEDLLDLPWLRVAGDRGPWQGFWFRREEEGPVGPLIRTADEWVTAIEAGRGAAFTMPAVMEDFSTARVTLVPVTGLPPAEILLAWRADRAEPLVERLVGSAQATVRQAAEA